jgi:FtsP/CotA-like multicopper oxidase with cupredoxin domain
MLFRVLKVVVASLAFAGSIATTSVSGPALDAIRANDNLISGGKLSDGVLTLHLEIKSGAWYPEADGGPSMKVDAFAEEGKALQIPGPLVRVPQGTELHVSFHNLLPATAIIHGMHKHPGKGQEVVEVAPGETREVQFLAGDPGTYQYFASAGGEIYRGRPFREDSQLHGAFIVDPPGVVAHDRVFVLGMWRNQATPTLSKDVAVINGKSWPYTERLTYASGQQARWRIINASDVNHPMHMHGSFYRVDSKGDGERDQIFPPEQQRNVVTELMPPGSTISTTWVGVPGQWIFHCHLVAHFTPSRTVANALSPEPEGSHTHEANHMAGLVLGISVPGERAKTASAGTVRKLSLWVKPRRAVNGVPKGFAYQLEESHHLLPSVGTLPGPSIILQRGQPVEITVVNKLSESTAVHWHGMELESYYDGVAGWGMKGAEVTPTIEPGKKFCAKFTPPRSGTFIYHTHLDDEVQLSGGLYGALIVLDPRMNFDAETDKVFLISAWGGLRSNDPKSPISLLLNGSGSPEALHWKTGRHYRVRIIDISPNIIGAFSVTGSKGVVQWRARAKDGADLPDSQAVVQDAKLLIGPGETYDFEYEPTESGPLVVEFKPVAVPGMVVQRIEVE